MTALRQHNSGFLLIEMIVTVSVALIVVASILTLYSFVFNSEQRENARLQGNLYAQEAMEAVSFIAQYDWSQMQDGTWHPEILNGIWKLIVGSEVVDGRFSRTISISSVHRLQTSNGHAFNEIVTSGGYNDPETKLVTVDVGWNIGFAGAQNVRYQMYQMRDASSVAGQNNWIGGPGQPDFSDATMFWAGENVDYSAPGILSLLGNYISWENATVTAEYNLPGNYDTNAISVVGNGLYLGTQNNSSGNEFFLFDITSLSAPVQSAAFNVGSDVNGIYSDGSYAVVATADNSAEIQILNVSNPSLPQLVTTYNLPGNDDALDVDASKGLLHVVQGGTLYTFDYSSPPNIILKDSLYIGAGVLNSVSAQGTKVYLASSVANQEFTVVDVVDPSNAMIIGGYDLPGNRQATEVNAYGFHAYIATSNSGYDPEFYMFNISHPATPTLLGTWEAGENVYTVAALANLAFVGTNLNRDDVKVLDCADPQNIHVEKGYEIKGTAADVYVTPEAIYLGTTANDAELIIISVNSNVPLYPSSGYLESSTLDTLSATSTLNWIEWLGEKTGQTAIKFQIASNNDATTWNFVGPDGTLGTYYSSIARELINYAAHLNYRYLRYKVILESGDQEQSPLLFGVDISYSQ